MDQRPKSGAGPHTQFNTEQYYTLDRAKLISYDQLDEGSMQSVKQEQKSWFFVYVASSTLLLHIYMYMYVCSTDIVVLFISYNNWIVHEICLFQFPVGNSEVDVQK
jgi:hypothetical protein